jgi:hypothetical protein
MRKFKAYSFESTIEIFDQETQNQVAVWVRPGRNMTGNSGISLFRGGQGWTREDVIEAVKIHLKTETDNNLHPASAGNDGA